MIIRRQDLLYAAWSAASTCRVRCQVLWGERRRSSGRPQPCIAVDGQGDGAQGVAAADHVAARTGPWVALVDGGMRGICGSPRKNVFASSRRA